MKRYCFAIDLIEDPMLMNECEQWRGVPISDIKRSSNGIKDMEIYRTAENRLFLVIEADDSFFPESKKVGSAGNFNSQGWEAFMRSGKLPLPSTATGKEHYSFLMKGKAIVESRLKSNNFTVETFAEIMGMGRSNLFRKIKAVSGLSINEFIRCIRLRRAADLILQTNIRIKEVAYEVGINDQAYFREQFVKVFGLTPSQFKKKNKAANRG